MGGLKKASPSRLRRRLRRSAERADAEKAAAEKATAEKAAAEIAAAEKAATVKAAAEKVETDKAAAEKAERAAAEKAAAERAAAEKTAAEKVAAKSEAEESEMTATTSSSKQKFSSDNCVAPLPLCLYCCHHGSGDHLVHFDLRCLCSELKCVCQCYCTEKQVTVKRKYFTHRDWEVIPLTPEERAEAHAFAYAQDRKFYSSYNGCTNPRCLT